VFREGIDALWTEPSVISHKVFEHDLHTPDDKPLGLVSDFVFPAKVVL